MSEKQTAKNGIGKGQPGPGRPKGIPNKNTKLIKDMIAEALEKAGGVKYLVKQATENPAAFLTLIGKTIPLSGDLNVNHEWADLLAVARNRAFAEQAAERDTLQ